MSSVEPSEQFFAAHALCKDLVVRAAYFTDQQDHDAFAGLFTEDAQLARPGGAWLNGRVEILASYRAKPADRITRHLVSNTIFLDAQPRSARAISYVQLWSTSADATPEAFGRKANARQVLGEFHDSFVKTEHGWRIAKREAVFIMYKD